MVKFMIERVVRHLAAHQGCTIGEADDNMVEITDAMGFRYQLVVRPIGRNTDGPTDRYDNQNVVVDNE